jgi:predicted metalloendopeptidase
MRISSNTLSPGNNFYLYVNNAWLTNQANQIPNDYSSWGGFTKLYDDGLNNQIDIVKNLDNTCYSEEESKIFSIWKASEDRFESWKQGTCNCDPIINEFNILDKHFYDYINKENSYISCIANYFYYTQINGIGNIMDFDTGSDLKNVNNVVLDFSVGGLSLPSREYYKSPDFSDKMTLFEEHLKNVKQILEKFTTIDSNFVNNVLEFENKIADFTMTPDQSREYDKYYTNTTIHDFSKEINNLNSLPRKQENYNEEERDFKLDDDSIQIVDDLWTEICFLFKFEKTLTENFEKNFANKENPPNKHQITVFDGDAIRRVMNLIIDKNNYNQYKSYMQYQIIKSFQGFCTKELDNEFFDFYSRKLGGQQEQKPDIKRSIGIVNSYAGEMMGKLFVKEYFPEQSKQNMQKLVDNVLNIMDESLKTNDWLTDETKSKAINKLSTFTSKIGYPNVWKDYSDFDIQIGDSLYEISKKAKKWSLRVNFFEKINSVLDREEWRMTPQTVNAYFMPTQNEIVFPAAILQPPFFHSSKDSIDFDISDELSMVETLDVVTPTNYGGIGAVIAHEITHGYDDKGRKFDADGNLNDWWCEKDEELFKKKTDIMVNSVSKYIYKDEEDGKEHKMNAELTMGENLADIGGLSLSMKALLKHLDSQNANNITVKASLRVFFKSWANVWKQNIKKDKRIMLLNVDPHAPTDFRGNLVQHMDAFYEVFDITETDNMYLKPEDRMKMW